MDLQTRKLTFVKEFLNIQSEEIVDRFEKMLKKEKKRGIEKDFQPFTHDEFYKRIDQSMSDSKNGKLTNIDELITEIDINKENDRIEIVDVFDTRQNPISIKRSK